MIAFVLAFLGLCLGSFLNAMVWRMHAKKDWVRGRSQCDFCGHQLSASDLVPLLSYLSLRGRCRYCKRRLSWQHPLVELATAVVFVASYYFWPGGVQGTGQWILFGTWLATAVGLIALAVYDFRWMLLPNQILYPTALIAGVGRLIYLIGYEPRPAHAAVLWVSGLVVASGVFLLLFILSQGRWIGFGDVRLGLVTGSVLADPSKGFLMILLASVLGTVVALPSLISGKKTVTSKLPYGPFLIAATWICLLFGTSLIDWYRRLFIS